MQSRLELTLTIFSLSEKSKMARWGMGKGDVNPTTNTQRAVSLNDH